jgi:hypothetical protein
MSRIEILYFEGCPNYPAALAMVERVVEELGCDAEVETVNVASEDAQRLRFLGSPSVRVDGYDIEPGADERSSFQLACRIYRTERGTSGEPDEAWLRQALESAR